MKKYILLGSIYGIGGWQLYINSRASHRRNCGDNVFVLSGENFSNTVVKLNGILSSEYKSIFELRYSPICFSYRQIKNVIDSIKLFVDYHDDDICFVESTSMELSLWGELIAKEMKCRNYSYLLHSHIDDVPNDQKTFFSFKYDRLELSGQTEITLPDLFKDFRTISDTRPLSATWDDPLCDYREDCSEHLDIIKSLKSVGYKVMTYFGTLNKPHFTELCSFIKEYANDYNNEKFLFITIGSSFTGEAEKKQSTIQSQNTITMNVPELYPVPKDFFSLSDLCFSSWGSATVAAYVCNRTIRFVDDISIVPQGIIGITLQQTPYYKLEKCSENLRQLVDKILFSNMYDNIEYVAPPHRAETRSKQINIDSVMMPFKECDEIYYEISKIRCASIIDKRRHILFRLIGTKKFRNLLRIKNIISKK